MLSTIDNPYNPYTDLYSWYMWDLENGYNTCAYLDRAASMKEPNPELHDSEFLQSVIDEIVETNALGIHIKVSPPEEEDDERNLSTP